jgi:hypothetical protein
MDHVDISSICAALIPSQAFLSAFLTTILVKAWFEVSVMSFFMSALAGHVGFKSFVYKYFHPSHRAS